MAFRHLPNYQVVIWHSVGLVTLTEITNDFNRIVKLEKEYHIVNYMANISDSELTHIKFDEVRQLYLLRKNMTKDRPVKTALFVKTSLQYGVARIYQTLMADTNNKVIVFKEKAECVEFLNIPLEILFPD